MKSFISLLLTAASMVIMSSASAKVTLVYPGSGTLKAAIEAAEPEDTLVLASGSFYEPDHLPIGKSITIRSEDKQNKAIVTFREGYDLQPGSTDSQCPTGRFNITLQGIKLIGTNGNTGTYLDPRYCLNELNILESEFVNTGFYIEYHYEPSKVRFIGNKVQNHIIYMRNVVDAYIAGNEIVGGIHLYQVDQAHVVGNQVDCRSYYTDRTSNSGYAPSYGTSCSAIRLRDIYNSVYAIANKITMPVYKDLNYDSGSSPGHLYGLILSNTTPALVANNHIKFEVVLGDNTLWLGKATQMNGVWANTKSYSKIYNNLVEYDASLPPLDESQVNGAIQLRENESGEVYNNIVINAPEQSIDCVNSTGICTVSNNICHNSAETCDEYAGNLNVDPLLAANTYAPTAESPAIDAGIDLVRFKDLDTTRADIGLHGGPYGYTQFSSQLEDSDNPFIYPIFNNIAPVDAGSVAVKVLAVARM